MDIQLSTPALLFPTVSLLLLAYTNRFLALANLIRNLHARYKLEHESIILPQIKNLRRRLTLVRLMQAFGVLSLFFCVMSMMFLFEGHIQLGRNLFSVSLILMMTSLAISVWEIHISSIALNIQISDIEVHHNSKNI